MQPRTTGYLIFKYLLGLTALMFIAYAVVVSATYPDTGTVLRLTEGMEAADRLAAAEKMRADWVQQTTSLGQLLIFGSLIPLLGTVIGYVLGDRRSQGPGDGAG